MNKQGIETLKKNITVAAKLIEAIDLALEDGKISAGEAIGAAFKAVPLIGVVKNIKEAKNEIADLTAVEVAELNAHFAKEFNLRNDKAEAMVEMVISLLFQLVDSTEIFKKLKN